MKKTRVKMTNSLYLGMSTTIKKKKASSNRENKKVPGLFNDKLEGKIKTEFFALRPKPYSYLDQNCN